MGMDEHKEMKRNMRSARILGSTCISLLLLLELFTVAKLQGVVDWSWILVFSPWVVLELFLLTYTGVHAPAAFAASDHGKSHCGFFVQQFNWGLTRLLTSLL